jgi:hypothetical protein
MRPRRRRILNGEECIAAVSSAAVLYDRLSPAAKMMGFALLDPSYAHYGV